MKNKSYFPNVLKAVSFVIVLFIALLSYTKVTYAETKVDYWDGEKTVTVSEKKFLQKYGCYKKKAFYKGYDESGELAVKLYFNPKTKKGCGISYHEGVTFGFGINGKDQGYSTTKLNLKGRYSLVPQQDIFDTEENNLSWKEYLKEYFPDAKEKREYQTINKKKKLTAVTLTGKSPEFPDSDPVDIIKVTFNYSKSGRLLSKEVSLWYEYFMTTESHYVNYYNASGQLYYRTAYITHGDLQYMFIYDKDKKVPAYVLQLDHYPDGMSGTLLKVVE